VEPDPIERELEDRELARRSFRHFCEYMFDWPVGSVPMHLAWDDHIRRCWARNKGAGIMAPRSHGKTTQVSVARNLFMLGQSTEPDLAWRPDIRIKLFQNTATNAQRIVRTLKSYIENDRRLHNLFPRMEPDPAAGWGVETGLFLKRSSPTKDPSFEGSGIESAATSGRADVIELDDVCDINNSVLEPARRKRIAHTYFGDIFQLREPWTKFLGIGTAWHELDLNAQLQKSELWDWVVYRIQDEPGGPMKVLWPGKWDIEQLKVSLASNEREFERGFNNRPYAEGESLVDWDAVCACMDDSIALGETPFHCRVQVAGYDLAIGKNAEAAHFAAFTWGGNGDKFIPLDIRRAQGLPFRQQIETVKEVAAKWMPNFHIVENNGYQQAMVDQLRQEAAHLPVEPFTTGRQKSDPYIGLPSLAPAFKNRLIVIPTKGGHDGMNEACQCPLCTWLRELRYFPATSSDVLMASWFGFDKIRRIGTGSARPSVSGARTFAPSTGRTFT